jgi:hypothetical protein
MCDRERRSLFGDRNGRVHACARETDTAALAEQLGKLVGAVGLFGRGNHHGTVDPGEPRFVPNPAARAGSKDDPLRNGAVHEFRHGHPQIRDDRCGLKSHTPLASPPNFPA